MTSYLPLVADIILVVVIVTYILVYSDELIEKLKRIFRRGEKMEKEKK